MTRLRNILRTWRAIWGGMSLAALVLAWVACGSDQSHAELLKTTRSGLTCVQRVTQAMRTADGCPAKIAAADLVAQTDSDCRAAGLTELGLTCPDAGEDGGRHD